ncbi:MAG: MASE3 domain-containing protein [Pseudomonadota bacterium]
MMTVHLLNLKIISLTILLWTFILSGLYLSRLYSYLLFHSLAEIFSIVVATSTFLLVWNARRYFRNDYMLFIGIAALFVSGLDIPHLLAYKGMPVFQGYDANLPTQLWIAARYLQSLSLLIAPLFFHRTLNPKFALSGFTAVTALLLASIFYWDIFPTCYVEGVGLTLFKITSEYIISLILLISAGLLYQNRKTFDPEVFRFLIWFFAATITAEMSFTLYIGVYDFANFVGHIFKIGSYVFLYRAIIVVSLRRPCDVLFRDLKQSRDDLQAERNNLKVRVQQRTAELATANERYRNTLDNMLEGCQMIGHDWRYLYVNEAAERHNRRPKEELLGKKYMDMWPGIEATEMFAAIKRCMEERVAHMMDNLFVFPEGTVGWFEFGIQPVPGGILLLSHDITQRKRMEKENAIIAEIGRVVGSTLNIDKVYERVATEVNKVIPYDRVMVALKKANANEYVVAYVSGIEIPNRKVGNKQPIELTTTAAVMKTRVGMLVQPADAEEIKDLYVNLYNDYKMGLLSTITVPLISMDEVIGSIDLRSKKLKAYTDHDLHLAERIGMQIAGAIANAQLFADLKESERALRDSQEKLIITQFSVDSTSESIARVGEDGRFLQVNDAYCRLLGYPSEELLSMRLYDVDPTLCAELWPGFWAKLIQEERKFFEAERRKKDGTIIPVEVNINYLAYDHNRFMIIFCRDISERKQHEKQLIQRFDRLAALRAIDMAITSSLDVRVVMNVFLDQVTSTLGVDAADVLLMNSGGYNKLVFVAGRGFQTNALRYTKLSIGEGIAGRIAYERKTICIHDLKKETEDLLKKSQFLHKENFVAYFGTPLIAKGQVKGILEVFNRTPIEPDQEWLNFLEALASQAAIAVDNATLFDNLQKSNLDLVQAYDNTLEGWSRALDLRDKETEGHSERVTEMTINLAQRVGMRDDELMHVRRGALLHDIGKMGIPDGVLFKPGALNDEEREIIYRHPSYAYTLLSPITYLKPALDIPYCHHERWDGTGYPRGLKEEQIPLAARIFAVVDVWDALRSDRPYRPAWPQEKTREYIREQAGKYFDPQVVELFLELLDE